MARKWSMPATVWLGENALEQAKNDISKLGNHALIVTGKSMIKQGYMKQLAILLDDLSIKWTIYSDISGEPTDIMIEAGSNLYIENQCDFIIGFGGGSPLDSAKAIAVQAGTGKPINEFLGQEIKGSIPPIVAIPSTAGTGSEVTAVTIITDTKKNIKMLLKGSDLIPKVAIVDPVFTLQAPKSVTVATGLDALTHAIEAYTSKQANEQADRYAVAAIKKIFSYLPLVLKDAGNLAYREQMSIAAYEAGVSFSNSSVTLVHGMSRPIGALFHVPHGLSNAMLLNVCLTYALEGAIKQFAKLANVIGIQKESEEADAKAFVQEVSKLCEICEVPTLLEYGVNETEFMKQIDKMSKDAMESGSPLNTRRTIDQEAIKQLYSELWR